MPEQQPSQQSYLLHLWQEETQSSWRASLQDVATSERFGFADLPSLFLFIEKQTGASAENNPTGVNNENERPPKASE